MHHRWGVNIAWRAGIHERMRFKQDNEMKTDRMPYAIMLWEARGRQENEDKGGEMRESRTRSDAKERVRFFRM